MYRFKYLVLLVVLVPAMTLAAFDTVTHTSGAQVYLSGKGAYLSIGTGTKVQSYTVNTDDVSFVVNAGSAISLTSADKYEFTAAGAGVCNSVAFSCGTDTSSITIDCSNGISEQTITITPTNVCTTVTTGNTSGATLVYGGSGGGGGGGKEEVKEQPPVKTPVKTPIVSLPPTTSVVPVVTATGITLSNPESAVIVSGITKVSYQPNETLKFSYKYKNESAKTVTVKIFRQLLDSKGKVVKTSVATKLLKKGATFTGSAQETISKTLKPGLYTERVRVLNTKSQTLDENSFVINIEKPKSKVFSLGEVESLSSDLAFDGTALSKVKTNVKLPTSLKLKYSYTNSTDKKHTTRMVRQLINASGKVVQTNTGKWVMDVGEKYAQSFTQSLASTLSAGDYTLKITAYDWTTKELLAENGIGFVVELK